MTNKKRRKHLVKQKLSNTQRRLRMIGMKTMMKMNQKISQYKSPWTIGHTIEGVINTQKEAKNTIALDTMT